MGQVVLKIALYLFCVLVGFSVFAVFAHVMVATNGFPAFEQENDFALFRDRMLQGAIWAWLAGSISALFYFWLKSGWRKLFLILPIVFPLVFCLYYTFIAH